MADQEVRLDGGAIEVETTEGLILPPGGAGAGPIRGTFQNVGPQRIYLRWNADTVDADEDPQDGKIWLDLGEICEIPPGTKQIAAIAVTATSKLFHRWRD